MPELPEVETLARGLRKYVVGKTIARVEVRERKKFRGTPSQLRRQVAGKKVTGVSRRAKWLCLELASHYCFVIHLKMTGQLLYDNGQPKFLGGHTMGQAQTYLPNSHTRVVFHFTDSSRLFFQDMRKFGYVELYNPTEAEAYFILKKLALEPIAKAFTFDYFSKQLKRHPNTSIKAMLLNQSAIAGLGNIYADDTCWAARIKPMRRVRSLTLAERRAVFAASRTIVREAIRLGGTSFSHYYQVDGRIGSYWSKRKVYDRTGDPCRRCRTLIKKTRCAGRGTHYCPRCQK